MHPLERECLRLRHAGPLRGAHGLWDFLRPTYDRAIASFARHGVERTMNGTDSIRLHPGCRHVAERYEPEVWQRLMEAVRPGDTAVDVGAHIGLYTLALAQRVGEKGRVIAFEPDPANAVLLKRNLALNPAGRRVEVVEAVVGDTEGTVPFEAGKESQSHVGNSKRSIQVRSVTLDRLFADRKVDLLKIDVEGFEGKVLKGAARLLKDSARKPREIFLEAHPYAWTAVGFDGEALLDLLSTCGYRPVDLRGQPVTQVECWGEIIAVREEN